VGEVLCPHSPAPQGPCRPFCDIPRVPACPPQLSPRSSTDPRPHSTDPAGRMWRGVTRRSALVELRHRVRATCRRTPTLACDRSRGAVWPAGKCEKGPHRYERQGPFTGDRRASPTTPSTGTGDAPVDPVIFSDPTSLRHPAGAAPLRQAGEALYGSSSPTDPALPGGSAWEKFYARNAQCHKGFRRISFTYREFRRVLHNLAPRVHRAHPGSPQLRRRAVDLARRAVSGCGAAAALARQPPRLRRPTPGPARPAARSYGRPRADGRPHRRARRPGRPPATRPRFLRPAPRSPGTRSR
jgi:hypothetical protein